MLVRNGFRPLTTDQHIPNETNNNDDAAVESIANFRIEPLETLAAHLENNGLAYEPGSVLLSAESTLRPGLNSDLYFIGLNPGGENGDCSIFGNSPTIFESLAFSRMGVSGWDQDWSRKKAYFAPGRSPMQLRFKHMARQLKLSYGEIFATNLIFARSRRFKALSNATEQIAACLSTHELMLDIVKPKRLWVMGNPIHFGSALKLSKDVRWVPALYQDKNDWSIGHGTAEFCGHKMTFCHTPHLSFWDPTAPHRQRLIDFAFHGTDPGTHCSKDLSSI